MVDTRRTHTTPFPLVSLTYHVPHRLRPRRQRGLHAAPAAVAPVGGAPPPRLAQQQGRRVRRVALGVGGGLALGRQEGGGAGGEL